MIASLALLVIVLLLLLLLKLRKRHSHTTYPVQARRIQQRWWLFGFDVAFQFARWVRQGVVLRESTKWFEQHGRTFSVCFAGRVNICTADEVNVKAVLSNDDFEISFVRRDAFFPVVGNGMIATNGHHATHGRRVLRRMLTQKHSRDFSLFEAHVQNLFALLPTDGSTIDLQELLPLFTMDTSSQFLLGQSTFWLKTPTLGATKSLSQALDYVTDVMRTRTDLGIFVHLHWDRKFRRNCKLLHEFVESYIAQVATSHESLELKPTHRLRNSYVQELIFSGCDMNSARGHILTSILAGRDTTASLIGFVIWNLARYPFVQEKLRKAIKGLKLSFTFEDLREIDYLWWTIKEVLRLYPSIPANDRAAKHDTYLPRGGGVDGQQPAFVPAGCVIDIHTWAMQRDRSVWGETADEFVPERWDNHLSQIGFMPFGAGSRTCPGQELAINQTAYLITRLLQTYASIESRGEERFEERITISLGSSNGFKIALRV